MKPSQRYIKSEIEGAKKCVEDTTIGAKLYIACVYAKTVL